MKGHLDVKQLESYKKVDLQQLARDLGVSDEGTVKEIAARCAEVEVDIPDNSELTDEEKAAAEQAAKEAAEKAEAEQAAKEAAEKAAAEQAAKEAAEKAEAEQAAKEAADKAAGKVKVEVTKRYLDKQLNQIKDAGETFTVDKTRADELVAAKVATIKG